jgi:hypothetical protein
MINLQDSEKEFGAIRVWGTIGWIAAGLVLSGWRTLAIGVVAWPVRHVIFAFGTPAWLVIASLAFHGFCYVFFFVTEPKPIPDHASRGARDFDQNWDA